MTTALTLCVAHPARADAIRIVDDAGVTVTLTEPARRVVPLYGAFIDLSRDLGREEIIVARTANDAADASVANLPSVGTHMRPSAEIILSLKPDLILALGGRDELDARIDSLRSLGLNVAVFNLDSFASLFSAVLKIGALTGSEQRAEELVASWRRRLAAIPIPGDGRIKTFFEIRRSPLLAAGRKGIVNDIIVAAGGENAAPTRKKIARVGAEAVLMADPEAYIYQRGPMNPAPRSPAEIPELQSIRAVRDGAILEIDEREFSRPGGASVTAAEKLAKFYAGIKKKSAR